MLLSIRKKTVVWWLMAALFISSFSISFHYFHLRPRVRLGERVIFCNPRAKISPRRVYHLKLWDYNWPVNRENGGYKALLEKAVADFRRLYPNIEVEITLLNFINGPQQFAQALQSNQAPDVYCSAFTIPPFDFKRQIPVGFFLKKEETAVYYPSLLNLTMRYSIACYFPRWTAPGIWIGNQQMMEKAGLSISQLQQQGWSLANFWGAASKVPLGAVYLVGNPGYNGFFTQLMADGMDPKNLILSLDLPLPNLSGITDVLDGLGGLIIQRKIPTDFDSNMIGRFLAGKSMLMAGVRPILFRFLKERTAAAQNAWSPVLLPPPSSPGPKQLLLVENSVIGVYRNKFTSGNDHLSAAVQLGKFLSAYPQTEPYQEMMVVPAHKENARAWADNMKALRPDCRVLIHWIEKLALVDLGVSPGYQEMVYPVLQEFLAGKISKEIAISRLISEKNLIPDAK